MPKNLEEFVHQNREAFDNKIPPSGMYRKIEESVNEKTTQKAKVVVGNFKWSIAAAALLVVGLSIYFGLQRSNTSGNVPTGYVQQGELIKNADTPLLNTNPELKAIEDSKEAANEFVVEERQPLNVATSDDIKADLVLQNSDPSESNKIGALQAKLEKRISGVPHLQQQFKGDQRVLEENYKQLQKQLAVTPNRDVIIKAMVQNLQLQEELLKRQLTIVDEHKLNNKKTKNYYNGKDM